MLCNLTALCTTLLNFYFVLHNLEIIINLWPYTFQILVVVTVQVVAKVVPVIALAVLVAVEEGVLSYQMLQDHMKQRSRMLVSRGENKWAIGTGVPKAWWVEIIWLLPQTVLSASAFKNGLLYFYWLKVYFAILPHYYYDIVL